MSTRKNCRVKCPLLFQFVVVIMGGVILFAACATDAEPTAAPIEHDVAERPSAISSRISATPTFRPTTSLTSLPSTPPTTSITLNETVVPLTPTSAATETPLVTPISRVSQPFVSSQGQLAYVQNQVLYVETAVGLGEFVEIGRYVSSASWSPDGTKMLYDLSYNPGYPRTINEFRLLFPVENRNNSLAELINDFPETLDNEPVYDDGLAPQAKWRPGNDMILFSNLIPGEYPELRTLSVVDLNQKSLSTFEWHIDPFKGSLPFVSEDFFILKTHCGAPCERVSAYDYNGQNLWNLPWATGGLFAFAPDGKFLINTGRVDTEISGATVDEINLETGEVKIIWQTSTNDYFPFFPPHISPDGNYISFHLGDGYSLFDPGYLNIIDRNGRSYGQRENSILLDWRPGGGPVVKEAMATGENQLVYWPLDGAAARIFVTPKPFTFVSGKWSGDGRTFVYSALDERIGASYLYLWQPESGVPQLIHSAASEEPFQNFTWLPDGEIFYFNLGNEALWRFELETAVPDLIAATTNDP
jgi:hypothetical protein